MILSHNKNIKYPFRYIPNIFIYIYVREKRRRKESTRDGELERGGGGMGSGARSWHVWCHSHNTFNCNICFLLIKYSIRFKQ